MSNRNRSAGHWLEREVVKKLKVIGFPFATTSRSESRSRDNQKIDIINTDEVENGRLPYNIQCKNTSTSLPYHSFLAEMPDDKNINVIIHNKTKKVNTQFRTIGQYAIMNSVDFYKLIEELETLKCKDYGKSSI